MAASTQLHCKAAKTLVRRHLHHPDPGRGRQDFPTESIIDNRSASNCLQLAASGLLARTASRARSIALSTRCQSAAARGFNDASASSHWVSRSLMRVLAPARSPLSTSAETPTGVGGKGVGWRSPADIAASASGTNEMVAIPCERGSLTDKARRPAARARVVLNMDSLLGVVARTSSSGLSWEAEEELSCRARRSLAVVFERQPRDERDNDRQEYDAGDDRAEACAAIAAELGQKIAERGPNRTRQALADAHPRHR